MRASQERSRERILTQPDPAKIRKSSDAVVLKEGSVFLVATEDGDIPFGLPHGFGLFFKDCRVLDGYEMTLNGAAPTLLSGISMRGFEAQHHLTNPELPNGDGTIEKNTIAIDCDRLIRGGVIHDLQSIRNHGRHLARLTLELRFRSKFQDLFVVRGFVQQAKGSLRAPRVVGKDHVELGYEGKDGIVRTTTLVFSPRPAELDGERAVFEFTLPPGKDRELAVTIIPAEGKRANADRTVARPETSPAELRRWQERSERTWLEGSATVAEAGRPPRRRADAAAARDRLAQCRRLPRGSAPRHHREWAFPISCGLRASR